MVRVRDRDSSGLSFVTGISVVGSKKKSQQKSNIKKYKN